MNKWNHLLLLLLGVSVAFNVYLLSTTPQQNEFAQSDDKHAKVKHTSSSEPLLNFKFTDQSANATSLAPQAIHTNNPTPNTPSNQPMSNRIELLEQANLWLQQSNFLKLGTFLQGYLKHPEIPGGGRRRSKTRLSFPKRADRRTNDGMHDRHKLA